MIPPSLVREIEDWISKKSYGELKIFFQAGNVQRWVRTVSVLPTNGSGFPKNPGPAPQGKKLEDNKET